LSLSVRAKDDAEIAEALKEYKQSNASSGTTSLGDLLKEQLDQET
jgi:small subunit ribosomal protein S1